MGALIQTKGTQRLATWFNKRSFANLKATRGWKNKAGLAVPDAFRTLGKLLTISDAFIAENADPANWPAGMNDIFYPSATLAALSGSGSTLKFKPPGTKPDAIVDQESFVCCINKPNRLDKKTKVQTAVLDAATGVLTVNLTKPLLSNPIAGNGELFSFSFKKGRHERLVRRWRWYLERDLTPQNDGAIRQAISTALDADDFFVGVVFQTVEDTQRVIAMSQPVLDGDDEIGDDLVMSILLMTQATTSPDKLDPQ